VAAAPRLLDDLLNASPELALVDGELAAQLRAEIRSGEDFRPRDVARPEFRLVLPDAVSVEPDTPAPEESTPSDDAEPLEEVVVEPVLVDLAASRDATNVAEELLDFIVLAEETPPDDLAPLELDATPATDEHPALGQPTYLDVVRESETTDSFELPEYVVMHEELAVESVDVSAEVGPANSDYPILPDLGEASEALEETDAALLKIREQLTSGETSRSRRRLRRGFIVASGLGAFAAVASLAVQVELGVVALPGWLGF
jgi:hypothetical protein